MFFIKNNHEYISDLEFFVSKFWLFHDFYSKNKLSNNNYGMDEYDETRGIIYSIGEDISLNKGISLKFVNGEFVFEMDLEKKNKYYRKLLFGIICDVVLRLGFIGVIVLTFWKVL